MRNLNPGTEAPRYHQLALALAERIGKGEYPVGALIPGEEQLCREYSLSRHTVRSALRELQDAGLVQKRNGVGTRVIAAAPARAFVHTIGSVDELVQHALDTRLTKHRTRLVKADARLARDFGCARGAALLRIDALRIANQAEGEVVIAWSRIHVLGAYAAIADELASVHEAIGTRIEARFGEHISAIEQLASAVVLDAQAARRLAVAPGSAALRIDRRYLGANGKPFEIATSLHPADRFTLSMRLDRRHGA